jgi:hypothetical protein
MYLSGPDANIAGVHRHASAAIRTHHLFPHATGSYLFGGFHLLDNPGAGDLTRWIKHNITFACDNTLF